MAKTLEATDKLRGNMDEKKIMKCLTSELARQTENGKRLAEAVY